MLKPLASMHRPWVFSSAMKMTMMTMIMMMMLPSDVQVSLLKIRGFI